MGEGGEMLAGERDKIIESFKLFVFLLGTL